MEKFIISQIFQHPESRKVTMLADSDSGQVQLGPFPHPEVCDLMEGDIIEMQNRDVYQLRIIGTKKSV